VYLVCIISTYLKEIGDGVLHWVRLPKGRDDRWVLVDTAMDFCSIQRGKIIEVPCDLWLPKEDCAFKSVTVAPATRHRETLDLTFYNESPRYPKPAVALRTSCEAVVLYNTLLILHFSSSSSCS